MTLTATATEKVQDFIQEHSAESEAGLRVAVLPGGCSGFQYGLNIEDEPESDDEILDIRGVKIFIQLSADCFGTALHPFQVLGQETIRLIAGTDPAVTIGTSRL